MRDETLTMIPGPTPVEGSIFHVGAFNTRQSQGRHTPTVINAAFNFRSFWNGQGNNGFNAATETYEDLVKAGVIDPAKVVRTSLQNAASVSGLLLTTEAMIADKPEEGGGAGGGMPGGGMPGGMPDMGGMM